MTEVSYLWLRQISIHALREEGDTVHLDEGYLIGGISIHALREEGDHAVDLQIMADFDFYPRPPRGGRPRPSGWTPCWIRFLSTPSARRATRRRDRYSAPRKDFYPRPPRGGRLRTQPPSSGLSYFYPRPPRGGRPAGVFAALNRAVISIHALREEGDKSLSPPPPLPNNFYPRPPRGGRPLATKATTVASHFYPRPPRGGRLEKLSADIERDSISIHALREEGDYTPTPPKVLLANFYPRPPRGGRQIRKHGIA